MSTKTIRSTAARTTATLGIAALALVGCGSGESPEAPTMDQTTDEHADSGLDGPTEDNSASGDVTGHGVYTVESSTGAVITVGIPSDPVEDIEAYREAVQAEPVAYILAEVNNQEGEDTEWTDEIRIIDSEGDTHTYRSASWAVAEWSSETTTNDDYETVLPDGTVLSDEEAAELDEQYIELSDNYLESGNVDPAAIETIPFVGPAEVPEDIANVIVATSYGDESAQFQG